MSLLFLQNLAQSNPGVNKGTVLLSRVPQAKGAVYCTEYRMKIVTAKTLRFSIPRLVPQVLSQYRSFSKTATDTVKNLKCRGFLIPQNF